MRPAILAIVVLSLSEAVSAQQYINLIDDNLSHWMKTNGDDVTKGWVVEPGRVLHLTGRGGNIVTREEFGDFELWFEFRISTKGNSGVKYRVRQYDKSWLGLEYQVLDDEAFPRLTREHHTASLYDLVTPKPSMTRFNPPSEFNVGKIRVEGGRTRHWINGQLMIQEPLFGASWNERVSESKFRNREAFGQNSTGRLMLTDHNSEVWFRNVFLKPLKVDSETCPTWCNPTRRRIRK